MLKLGKKVEYGLLSVLHIDSLGPDALVSSREIAEHHHIPPELLGKVLQALTREGLIQSVHGARGGYQLARPLAAISLGDVLAAVEGPVVLAPCGDADHACQQASQCTIRTPLFEVQEMLNRFISGISLASFRQELPGDPFISPALATCLHGVCPCTSHNPTPQPTSPATPSPVR